MSDFSQPLVGLSLSEADDGLLQYVGRLAEWFEWKDVQFAHVAAGAANAKTWQPLDLQARMRAEVERLCGDVAPREAPAFHAARGDRLDEILRLTVEHERDLVIVGHRRITSGRRSLARRLAMVAPTSVWLVPEGSPPQIDHILVPTDFSSHSADALAVAVGVARAAGLAQLHVIHVFFDPSTVRYDEHVHEVLGQEEEAFKRFVAGVDTRGVEIEPVFIEGTKPAKVIIRMAERYGTNLIVMNTRGRSQAASVLLGSTTSETMAATKVPLLAVKHFGGRMTLMQALVNHRIWERPAPKSN
jgi:nucleotide-binding universal stress UspA family protein